MAHNYHQGEVLKYSKLSITAEDGLYFVSDIFLLKKLLGCVVLGYTQTLRVSVIEVFQSQ